MPHRWWTEISLPRLAGEGTQEAGVVSPRTNALSTGTAVKEDAARLSMLRAIRSASLMETPRSLVAKSVVERIMSEI